MSANKRPRCECCDEILEEIMTMRQSFEKIFHRVNQQIVEMRREIVQLTNTTHQNKQSSEAFQLPNSELPTTTQNSISVGNYGEKRRIIEQMESEMAIIPKTEKESDEESLPPPIMENNTSSVDENMRVLPLRPFQTVTDFETWNEHLDTDKCLQLGSELTTLQRHIPEADRWIKYIWSQVLADDAAQAYSYRGNIKTNKLSLKDRNFAILFKSFFEELFKNYKGDYFADHTKRFLNYAQDRKRKMLRYKATKITSNNFHAEEEKFMPHYRE